MLNNELPGLPISLSLHEGRESLLPQLDVIWQIARDEREEEDIGQRECRLCRERVEAGEKLRRVPHDWRHIGR